MDEVFAKRVRDAAIAGWWTILIAAIVATVQWLGFMAVTHFRPDWVLCLWGPSMNWQHVEHIWIWFIGIFKLVIWIAVLVVIWLSLWARRLRRG